jgi:hypothetical protein
MSENVLCFEHMHSNLQNVLIRPQQFFLYLNWYGVSKNAEFCANSKSVEMGSKVYCVILTLFANFECIYLRKRCIF